MTKHFKVKEQVSYLQSVKGPSGRSYESIRGLSFSVDNPLDVAFFENNDTFVTVGLVGRLVEKPVASVSVELENKLKKLKVSSEGVDALTNRYSSVEALVSDLKGGFEIGSLSDKDLKAVKKLLKEA